MPNVKTEIHADVRYAYYSLSVGLTCYRDEFIQLNIVYKSWKIYLFNTVVRLRVGFIDLSHSRYLVTRSLCIITVLICSIVDTTLYDLLHGHWKVTDIIYQLKIAAILN